MVNVAIYSPCGLDRSNPQLGMESRMLTTAMLTKLADLRGRRQACAYLDYTYHDYTYHDYTYYDYTSAALMGTDTRSRPVRMVRAVRSVCSVATQRRRAACLRGVSSSA